MRTTIVRLGIAVALAPLLRAHWKTETTLQGRVGFDDNPIAVGGTAAAALGAHDTAFTVVGATLAVVAPSAREGNTLRLSYAGEAVRFAEWSGENYVTHRVAAAGQVKAGDWRYSADLSTLGVDGSQDTLLSLSACNANGTSLWRERRAQWQHRAKLLAQRDTARVRIRVLGTALDYDYRTRVRPGRVPFAGRSDALVGADVGWKQAAQSLWVAGVRAGVQKQDQVPLPGAAFDYSNRYTRLVAGWEGLVGRKTTVAVLGGPDFRRYHGKIDPAVFRGRERTLGWFEASAATKLAPGWSASAKTTRWTWLSSTGKSAYTDLSTELSLAWEASSSLTLRGGAKAHQCSYFPAVRNDWEVLGSLALVYQARPKLQFTLELLDHRGWNELPGFDERDFGRHVVSVGAAWKW